MPGKQYNWVKIAGHINEIEFAKNDIAVAEVKGKRICIGRFSDLLFGFSYKCPHAGGIMADGYIDLSGNIVCPVHRYKFNIKNGRNVTGEGYYLKNWPIEIRKDGIFIGMEENSGIFGWLG